MKKLLAVDGNSLINRAFYGVKPLTTRDGRNTNAVFGLINMLKSHIDSINPDYAVVAFDMRKPTFRHEKYDFYKATRKGMPEELAEQFDSAKAAARNLGFHEITCEGFEADDILGTLSTIGKEDVKVYILTGDRDSYQLVNEYVNVLYLSTKETLVIDENAVMEKYGVRPSELIEVKALMGDTSDNIPGVKGIGEKTAIGLVQKYGTVENLYSRLPEEQKNIAKGVYAKLEADKEMAFASRFLAEINKNAPINLNISDFEYVGINKGELCRLCEDLELNSIISRLGLRECDDNISMFETEILEYTGIQSVDDIKDDTLCCLFEDDMIYLCCGSGDVYRTPLNAENMKKILCDDKKDITVHDIKSIALKAYGIGIDEIKCKFYDVMLASYVADPSGVVHKENLAAVYGAGGVNIDNKEQAAILAVKNLSKLRLELDEKIKAAGQENLLYNVEFPLSLVLAEMENIGFLINREALESYGTKLDIAIRSRQETIYAIAGCEFNINSPKQLGEVLFEKMALPATKKTKNGYSTDAESLEKLRQYTPIIDEILEYRTVAKLKSTYADGLLASLGSDGRLHTNFKQALTLTGRLSSADPNLQNIPIRTAEGREIRKVFIPEDGKVLIDADYSQIELRVMAAVSGDENMISTYKKGEDIHTSTASQVFGVLPDDVTGDMRKKAKAINFGIIYGISDFSLAGDMKVTKKEASEYISRYFEKYPDVDAYLRNVRQKAYEDGFVTTLYGRKRYIPELKSRIYMQRMFGERVAMNAPIQGTAADIIKIAMIKVHKALKDEKLDAKLILQVHDELIVESSRQDAEKAKEILVREMENAVTLAVPLEVAAEIGETWDACHG
ncbi:MAG: DNA polymerase I [Clostridia bacterium]|nr:DNA polymerase I [Clostridia bacterium]